MPAARTPTATPRPAARPTVYQSPIGASVVTRVCVEPQPETLAERFPFQFLDDRRPHTAALLLVAPLGAVAPHGEPARAHRPQGARPPSRRADRRRQARRPRRPARREGG